MKIEQVNDREYWSMETLEDFKEFEILLAKPHKPGVKILHAQRGGEFHIIYCGEQLFYDYTMQKLDSIK